MCTPCKECKNRKLHCHNDCKLYLDFTQKNEEKKAEIAKHKDLLPTYGARVYGHNKGLHRLRGVDK